MRSIQLHITAGPNAGKRLLLEQSPITFGRNEQSTVEINLPTASRNHGELRYDAGRWLLVNHSANGTRLGRKLVTDKPREVTSGSVVSIGDQAIFDITLGLMTEDAPAPPDRAKEQAQSPDKALSGRAKLWIGIGIYLLIMLGGIVFAFTLDRGGESEDLQSLGRLTAQQIRNQISQPLPKRVTDPRQFSANINAATEQLALQGSEADALYRAHQAYRRARSFIDAPDFANPLHQRQALDVEEQLADQVFARYQRAIDLEQSGRLHEASDAFRKLLAFYPAENDSLIVQHVQEHWAAVRKVMGKRR